MHEITFFANEDQLDQLRYAVVDRAHELERLLLEGDCKEGYLQSSLNETRALAVALKIQIGPQADADVRSNFCR